MSVIYLIQVKGSLANFSGTRTITSQTAYRRRERAEEEAPAFKALCCDPDNPFALDPKHTEILIHEMTLEED